MSKTKRVATIFITVFIIAITAIFFAINSIIENNKILYVEEAEKYSERYGVDVYVTLAVMHTESKFDERAVSSAGAVGLMQLMPATAEWIARKLHMEYSYEKLFDAEYNIELGAYYLSYLLKSFEYEYALAAYNAGEGKVREWLSDGVKTDDIPYKETRDYVKRVIKKVYEIKESYYLY